jgi:hypothetical protein
MYKRDIFEAAEKGTVEDVRYFLDELGIDVNAGSKAVWEPPRMKGASRYREYSYVVCCVDFTPLHVAVSSNPNIDVIKYLISRDANVNAKNKDNINNNKADEWTPLHMAAINNPNAEIIAYLLSQGADIKTRNTYGSTLLHVTVHYNNSIRVIEYLISQGLDVNGYNHNSMTPLHYAAFYNPDVEILKYLISQGSNVYTNRWNETLLHLAAFSNPNVEIIKYLVSQGFDVNAESQYGETPLDLAEKNSNREIRSYLESLRADDTETQSSYDYIDEFHEGLARVRKGLKWGYIDETGNIVIPLIYKIAYNFENDVAIVSKTIVTSVYNYSHGYINREGKSLTSFVYETFELNNCREGLISMEKGRKYGFIDTNGEEVIPFIYDGASAFHEGLVSVLKDDKWSFIDKTSNEVIPFIYDEASEFHEGLAKVEKDGRLGYIDKTGRWR